MLRIHGIDHLYKENTLDIVLKNMTKPYILNSVKNAGKAYACSSLKTIRNRHFYVKPRSAVISYPTSEDATEKRLEPVETRGNYRLATLRRLSL